MYTLMSRIAVVIHVLLVLAVADRAPLLYANRHNINPGIYLVVFKDGYGVTNRDLHVNELATTFSSTTGMESQILSIFNIGSVIGYSAKLSLRMLIQELNNPYVKYIEADQILSLEYEDQIQSGVGAADVQSGATWGLDRIDQRDLPLDGQYAYNSSAGVNADVYVIDTGIYTEHQEFGGRAALAFNAVPLESGSDLNGHGTHCAGTIGGSVYGVAKQVRLYAVKVLNSRGSGSTRGVVDGVNYVTNNRNTSRNTVASMSLGGGASTTLDDAVAQSIASGVIYAIAAGNSNADACNTSPARVSTAVTVGATNRSDHRASYSNYGSCVTIFAPGDLITSAWIGSTTATNTISGTSMATPHVAGVLALHLSDSGVPTSPSSSKTWLTDVAAVGKVISPGSGSPNLLLYSPHV